MSDNNNNANIKYLEDSTEYRNTFGVIDKATGKIYPDIKNYFLQELLFDSTYSGVEQLRRRTLEGSIKEYKLLMDFKLLRALKNLPEGENTKVLVSFQEKFNGKNVAVARIYKR